MQVYKPLPLQQSKPMQLSEFQTKIPQICFAFLNAFVCFFNSTATTGYTSVTPTSFAYGCMGKVDVMAERFYI